MMKLRDFMLEKKQHNQKCFIAYVTAGDPDISTSHKIVRTLITAGVDVIELGVPFSDPVGDGPVNQLSAQRALQQNTSMLDVLGLVHALRRDNITTPIVLFTYFNPLFAMGITNFASAAQKAGVSGVLVVDLPPEESKEYVACLKEHDLDTIFLAAPTTIPERLKLIGAASTGFVYYVSRTGVTGTSSALSTSLQEELQVVAQHVDCPIAVGFGISTPEQAHDVCELADGVVIGSAIVKMIAAAKEENVMLNELQTFAESIAKVVHDRGGH